jgi:hypothetical protein
MVKVLNREELEKLTTARLLAYKDKLMKVPEEPNWDECDYSRINKLSPEWRNLYHLVKSVLSGRENIK